ncbi:hypothetical protein, partial [Wolbachia pipientis]|uniref:hypothetical protein n=1 Tax=Wolbachia pipientis TaxID=955 RepID=UPI00164B3997
FFDNYCRTQIRYIRALLEDTSSDISQSTILDKVNVLNQEITHKKTSTGVRFQETRTGVQFLLLRSKISKKYALLEETQRYANQGLNIARAKSMSTEIKMFEAILIESTRSQSGSPSSNLNEIDKMSINTKKHI